MKKLGVLILLVVLSVPCAAQAYYFSVSSWNLTSSDSNASSYNDTHGDQLDFVANSLVQDDLASGTVTAYFSLFSDYGTDIVRPVNVTLTDISNYDVVGGSTSPTISTYKLYELVGEGEWLLSDNEWLNSPSAPGDVQSSSYLEYFDMRMLSGTNYKLEFTYFADSATFTKANREISIDVNSEDMPKTPIPGAVWLLGTGIVGLVGLRRKLG